MAKDELLSFEEITRLVRVFSELGVSNVRLTGGEPLLRNDLPSLVGMIRTIQGISDIALTTNGVFLPEQADALARNGLRRVNVSLDSLDTVIFSAMARRDHLSKTLRGLEVLTHLPVHPVKINVVIVRGENDAGLMQFVDLARSTPFVVRFIEFMPIGADDGWSRDAVVSTREIIGRIAAAGFRMMPIGCHGDQPADRYGFTDGAGELGFISPVSDPFCASCNRVRITSDGKLRTCLFSHRETDLRRLVRDGAGDEDLKEAIASAVFSKEEGHLINRPGFRRPEKTMSQIGG
jgi:cyclic pyranopterin phosphate synthase